MHRRTVRTLRNDDLYHNDNQPPEKWPLDSRDTENPSIKFLLNEGRFEEAIPHLESLLDVEPCEAQDVVDLACAYQQTGRYERAVELFDHVLNAAGLNCLDRVMLYVRAGYCRLAMGHIEHAVRAFENAVSLDEEAFRAHVGLGLCMVHHGRKNDARECFEKAIAINPDCADAYSNLGVLALSENNANDALGLFKRALETDPMHRDALPNYLTTAFALGAFEEAESLLRCYADLLPHNPDLTYQLAYCRLKLGDEQQAQSLLQELLETDPDHEDARTLLAESETT